MGRSWRWLKGFLGVKEKHVNGVRLSNNNSEDDFEVASFSSHDIHLKEKKRWSFSSRSYKFPAAGISRDEYARPSQLDKENTEGKLAEAAANAADAAVMAARAAVVIVRLTAGSSSRRGTLFGSRERWAALTIQAVFRGFLARKALKAIKGFVKLQALIRGYMTRKETAGAVLTMQALARARATAPCQWPRRSLDKENGLKPIYWLRHSIEGCDAARSSFRSKRYSSWDRIDGVISDASPMIVETDYPKPRIRLSKLNRKDILDFDAYLPSNAWGSPMFRNYRSHCGPVTPTRSLFGECTAVEQHACPEYPNYMAITQSFEAKLRSTSAPKQRPIADRSRIGGSCIERSWRRGTA